MRGESGDVFDVDGRVFTRKKIGNTIYIQANYYVKTDLEMRSAKQATNIWNQRQDYYVSSSGEKFKIVYSLSVTNSLKHKPINRYAIVGISSLNVAGNTLNQQDISVRADYAEENPQTGKISSTGAHEIGHTLGMHHVESGIMSETQDDNRKNEVEQKNIEEMLASTAGIDIKLTFFERIQDFFFRLFDK